MQMEKEEQVITEGDNWYHKRAIKESLMKCQGTQQWLVNPNLEEWNDTHSWSLASSVTLITDRNHGLLVEKWPVSLPPSWGDDGEIHPLASLPSHPLVSIQCLPLCKPNQKLEEASLLMHPLRLASWGTEKGREG